MSRIIFFPPVKHSPVLKLKQPISLKELCHLAKVPCKASGAWIDRKVEILHGDILAVEAEPGDYGAVRIILEASNRVEEARIALTVLAYGLGDLVAKASIAGIDWSRISSPLGRRPTGTALTTAERQRLFRERKLKVKKSR